jgi:hypothetical protein
MSKVMAFLEHISSFLIGMGLAMAVDPYRDIWTLQFIGIIVTFIGMELRYHK